jgi:hypothetical protein
MTTSLAQVLPVSTDAEVPLESRYALSRAHLIAAFALGFLCFLPYPALPVGGNSAVQIGNVLSIVLALPLLLVSWKRQPYYLYLLIVIPLCIASLKVAVAQQPGLDVALKDTAVWMVACVTLLAAQRYFPKYSLAILTGVAIVTLIHVAVGAWQAYAFRADYLPLQSIYINPSFLSVQDNATVIVRYIRRPFGLFPEPSAMSSSLAPFVLLWFAELFGLVRYVAEPARWQRVIFTIAAIGGLVLIVLSRSGHAMATLAVVLVFGAMWLKNAKPTLRNYLWIVLVFGVILPIGAWLTYLAIGERVAAGTSSGSWEDRSDSLIIGFGLWVKGDWQNIVFGLGTGLSGPAIYKAVRLEAVWSVLLTFVYETGVVGLIAVAAIARYLYRQWQQSGFSVVFLMIFLVWLLGVTVTTSYEQLLPIWLALGWFTVWPQICQSGRLRKAPMPQLLFAPMTARAIREARSLGLTPWDRDT